MSAVASGSRIGVVRIKANKIELLSVAILSASAREEACGLLPFRGARSSQPRQRFAVAFGRQIVVSAGQESSPRLPHFWMRKTTESGDTDRRSSKRHGMTTGEAELRSQVTQLLHGARGGDHGAFDRLLPLIYDELRAIARRQLRREQIGHTLRSTALVHEAYLKLVDQAGVEWRDRAHFFGIAARAMRQVLIDYARRRGAEKRGGDVVRTTLSDQELALDVPLEELLALDDALTRLAEVDERLRQVVEYRFFGGMPEEEIAEVLGVSTRTVQRDWLRARAWLYAKLYPGDT